MYMEGILFLAAAAVCCLVLYYIIKAAVRDGIIESRAPRFDETEEDSIAQVKCKACGRHYDMDYPKCPYCSFRNTGV